MICHRCQGLVITVYNDTYCCNCGWHKNDYDPEIFCKLTDCDALALANSVYCGEHHRLVTRQRAARHTVEDKSYDL